MAHLGPHPTADSNLHWSPGCPSSQGMQHANPSQGVQKDIHRRRAWLLIQNALSARAQCVWRTVLLCTGPRGNGRCVLFLHMLSTHSLHTHHTIHTTCTTHKCTALHMCNTTYTRYTHNSHIFMQHNTTQLIQHNLHTTQHAPKTTHTQHAQHTT